MLDKRYRKYQKPNFFQRNFSFKGEMSVGEFWSEMGVRIISFLCAAIMLCIAIVVMVPGETKELIVIVDISVPILAILWVIPMIAMTRRRLRDAGFSAKSYLWLLLPVIGWIVFVALLLKKSV